MANQLDEMNPEIMTEGRDVHVIAKVIPVETSGFEKLIPTILMAIGVVSKGRKNIASHTTGYCRFNCEVTVASQFHRFLAYFYFVVEIDSIHLLLDPVVCAGTNSPLRFIHKFDFFVTVFTVT